MNEVVTLSEIKKWDTEKRPPENWKILLENYIEHKKSFAERLQKKIDGILEDKRYAELIMERIEG